MPQPDNERNFLKRIVSHGVRSRMRWGHRAQRSAARLGRDPATRGASFGCAILQPLCIEPGVNVLSDLVLCDTVALLDHALELIALTGNPVQIVVSEIALLFLDLSLELLPISFDAIPIHFFLRAV